MFLMLGVISPAVAVPGDLDASFAGGGSVRTSIHPGPSEANAVVVQPDGKIVVAGVNNLLEGSGQTSKFVLARYDTDGVLDPTFGGDGIVTTDFTPFQDHAYRLAIQADGKIVAAGVAGTGGDNAAMAVSRYADGTLDPTFGGTGKVTVDFSPLDDFGNAVAIQPDGKIVVAGLSRCCGNARFAVARLNTDGTLDTSFGGDGKAAADITPDLDFGFSVAIQPDGKIVVAGVAGLGGDAQTFGLVRFDADGTLDPGFGIDGMVTTALTTSGDWGDDLVLQVDGKIVVFGNAGNDDPEFGLARYNPDGTLDPTFGGTGIVMTNFSTIFDWARSVVIQPDGKIVAVGGSAFTGGGTRGSVALARYDPDGRLDPTFGGDGKVRSDVTGFDDIGNAVAIQPDGKIVVAGVSGIGGRHAELTVLRFLST